MILSLFNSNLLKTVAENDFQSFEMLSKSTTPLFDTAIGIHLKNCHSNESFALFKAQIHCQTKALLLEMFIVPQLILDYKFKLNTNVCGALFQM